MAENSKIQWTTSTFNPWEGCSKVSLGCTNCYAEARADRFKTVQWGPNGTRRVASEAMWRQPVKWNELAACSCGDGFRGNHSPYCPQAHRPRVFCASLADVFEDWQGPMTTAAGHSLAKCRACSTVGHTTGGFPGKCKCGGGNLEIATMSDIRARLFKLIDATPNLDWLLLTKRPENFKAMLPWPGWPRENVWLGVSVEDQQRADERIPLLLQTPAAVRFLSVEPLLGRVDLCKSFGIWWNSTTNEWMRDGKPGIHWVICGGESGRGARRFELDWARSIQNQCDAANIPFFFKQAGSNAWDWTRGDPANHEPSELVQLHLRDKKGGELAELPSSLRCRDLPSTVQPPA